MVKAVLFDDVPDVVRQRMARIRKKDTKPELVVRRLAAPAGLSVPAAPPRYARHP